MLEDVLTNQFHDILPGSSITAVYTDAERDYADVIENIKQIRDKAAAALMAQVNTEGPGKPIVVFNTLGHARTTLVEMDTPLPDGPFHVATADGGVAPSQRAQMVSSCFSQKGCHPRVSHSFSSYLRKRLAAGLELQPHQSDREGYGERYASRTV
jgi:hypothetical protein